MTLLDETQSEARPKASRPRVVWVFGALAVIFFLVGLAGGSFQSKLGDVQKNDNSSFLPGSADSTKVANEQQKFARIQSIPGTIVYQRKGGLTAQDRQKIAADVATFKKIPGISADEVGVPQFKGDVAATSVPLIGRENGKAQPDPDR